MTIPSRSLPWLRLSLTPGLTGGACRRLLSRFETASSILEQSRATLEQVLDPAVAAAVVHGPGSDLLDAALAWAQAPGNEIIALDAPYYPPLLKETPDPPLILYAAGHTELLQRTAVAIVGSRNATAQGMRDAEAFARALAQSGICVVSGLALGIDAASHRGAIDTPGSTIAVLGSGIDIVYPRRNADLCEQIRTGGLLLSEFALGTPPIAANFPRRNRIISGIARGCLVVEAAIASGSLVTARLAADQGRDVFAIPGSIHSPLSRGCHHLIKQGAKLVEKAEDILEELGVVTRPTQLVDARASVAHESQKVMSALDYHPCDIDTLVSRTRMSIDKILPLLTELELEARISRNSDCTYQRLK